jgi:leader peptidase (prepilin peptidase)/N-methyltransferase
MTSLLLLAQAYPALGGAFVFCIGACVGSFLNVVILRVPQGVSIVRPGSHCACGQPIPGYCNIPILSWFFLRGRARCCGGAISVRYPLVEALTAALFLASWTLLPPGPAVCGWILLSGLIAASFIDAEHLVIPDVFTLGLGTAGVLLSMAAPDLHGLRTGIFALDSLRSGGAAIAGLLIGSGLVFWIAMLAEALLRKEAMGLGDVKFVGAIGAFCGWQGAVFSVFGGAAVGALWAAAAFIGGKFARGDHGPAERTPAPTDGTTRLDSPQDPLPEGHIPFGPMLAIAGALYFLCLHRWVDPWFAQFTDLF